MNFGTLPGPEEALKILREIASRPIKQAARKIDKPLALYGAGKLGKMAIELLERVGSPPGLIIDANPETLAADPFWRGRKIVAPAEVPIETRTSHLLAVSIATLPFEELAATLADQGWEDIVPFYDIAEAYTNVYPLSNGWILDRLDAADVSATAEVFDRWSDNISRAHHLQFLAWHRLREDWTFSGAPVNITDRYFIPEVVRVLNDQETFLDVGAHCGEVSERFRSMVNHRYRDVWMAEPDPDNAAKLKENLKGLPESERIRNHLLEIAVASKSGKGKFFSGLGYASQLSTFGTTVADVKTIDELNLTPSFIKLHIEGFELNALKGAKSTLNRNNPIIAATCYHNSDGLWALPKWLNENLNGYIQSIRMHSWCGTGAVVYAVPIER